MAEQSPRQLQPTPRKQSSSGKKTPAGDRENGQTKTRITARGHIHVTPIHLSAASSMFCSSSQTAHACLDKVMFLLRSAKSKSLDHEGEYMERRKPEEKNGDKVTEHHFMFREGAQ
jgi:hypothetical protein